MCSCSQMLREKAVRFLPLHLQRVFRASYFSLRGHRRGTHPRSRYLLYLIYLDYLCLWSHRRGTDRLGHR